MKTSSDPRHKARVHLVQLLFAWEFHQNQGSPDIPSRLIKNIGKIDQEIKEAALTWPIEKINRIDLSILRLAIFELIIEKKQPYKVIADESVELAKEFGSESTPSFVNGVLGKIITKYKLNHSK